MDKHKFNIFPEMRPEDHNRLLADIKINGYDEDQPICLYEGKILDGWNRQKVCDELEIEPAYIKFSGDKFEAVQFVMRTNKRRNLTSSQWAAIAAEADELWDVIVQQVEEERRKKIKKRQTLNNSNAKEKQTGELIPSSQKEKNKTRSKIAETFNTNERYVSDAKKYKQSNPDYFQAIKSGSKSITQIKQKEKQEKIKQEKDRRRQEQGNKKPIIYNEDCAIFMERFNEKSIDLLITDPPYSTDIDDLPKFLDKWLYVALSKIKDTGRAFICIGAYPIELHTYFDYLLKTDWIIDCPLVWTYRNTLGQTPKMKYNLSYQIILHLYKETSNLLNNKITNEMFSVQDINAPDGRQGNRLYKWQKPMKLAERLIQHSTKPKDLIIDPFSGVGTFLVAAAKKQRIAKGCEIDKDVLNIALKEGCAFG